MTSTPAKRALVVDDNLLNSRLVSLFLHRLQWETQVCDNGEDALAVLRHWRADLVLLDLRMPGLGGEEICRLIREDLGLRSTPVIAYTAHRAPEDRGRMMSWGFDGLLVKPISFNDVRLISDEFSPTVSEPNAGGPAAPVSSSH
jgi:CheY-like chemotaxis protein